MSLFAPHYISKYFKKYIQTLIFQVPTLKDPVELKALTEMEAITTQVHSAAPHLQQTKLKDLLDLLQD